MEITTRSEQEAGGNGAMRFLRWLRYMVRATPAPARPYRRRCRALVLSERLLKDCGLRREDFLQKGGPAPRAEARPNAQNAEVRG